MNEKPDDQLLALAQIAADESRFSLRAILSSNLPLLMILILGIVLAVGGAIATQYWEKKIHQTYLSGAIRIYENAVNKRLENIRYRSRLCSAYFIASHNIEPAEFKIFSQQLLENSEQDSFIAVISIEETPQSLVAIKPEFIASQNESIKSHIDAMLSSKTFADKLNHHYPDESHFVMIMNDTPEKSTILYATAFKKDSAHASQIVISGGRTGVIFDDAKMDLSLRRVDIASANHQPIIYQPETGSDRKNHEFSYSIIPITFANLKFNMYVNEDQPFLLWSTYFKWALIGFSLVFTSLLCAQFIYARRTVQNLATLAVQRANDLTSINSDLTDEIMNRIRFQAELLERNAEIQETNQKLEEVQNQLIQQEKMASLGQLAAGVAHEINNPIGFINSNLTMLDKYCDRIFRLLDIHDAVEPTLPDIATREEIGKIKTEIKYKNLRSNMLSVIDESREGVERVKRIVQDLKDFSRVDEAEWQWSDIHDGIDSTLNIAWNEIKYKAVVHKDYGDIPQVECVPSQINQVVMNLLVNAAQAIKDSGEIYIRTRAENDHVHIEIEDTGCGIPAANLGKIFDPFFTTKEVGKGTGLGLSLSYGIIKKHNGELKVRSIPGKGTTFIIILPFQQPESSVTA